MSPRKPHEPREPREPREDDTPVEGVPIEPMSTIAHRTRSTATDAKATLDTVNTLRLEMVESDRRNQLEHRQTSDKFDELGERVGKLEDHVGNLRVDSGKNGGKLDLIISDMHHIKEAAVHREKALTETQAVQQKALIETQAVEKKALTETQAVEQQALVETQAVEQRVTMEDAADAKKARRLVATKIVAVLAAIGTGITTYFGLR